MADLTKAELQEQLTLEQAKLLEAQKLQKEQVERIESLEQQLTLTAEEIEQIKTVGGVLDCINKLTDEEKKILTHEVRTTPKGIAAFMILNFGIGKASEQNNN